MVAIGERSEPNNLSKSISLNESEEDPNISLPEQKKTAKKSSKEQ
jgi:hypothetical protein